MREQRSNRQKDRYGDLDLKDFLRVNIAKSMVRLHNIEVEENRTRIEMKGVQLDDVKNQLLEWMNASESTLNE